MAEQRGDGVHHRCTTHYGLAMLIFHRGWQCHTARRQYLLGMESNICDTVSRPHAVYRSENGRKQLYYRWSPWRRQQAYFRVVIELKRIRARETAVWLSAYWCDGPQLARETELYRSPEWPFASAPPAPGTS